VSKVTYFSNLKKKKKTHLDNIEGKLHYFGRLFLA